MKHFEQVGAGIDVAPILAQIDAHPELWRSYDVRQRVPGSPHSQVDDIWLRGPEPDEMRRDRTVVARMHYPVFWPAWHVLTELQPHVHGLAAHIRATAIGGILLTRMAPGTTIDWHTDETYWHAETFNPKLYLTIKANPECVNFVEDEALVMREGEVWTFDNMKRHAVVNNGPDDRIVAIICLRKD